ncbi:MAG: helix-turn-helix domain-containing protein [Eggerthellaceae bacterium]|nr:helix-turn-helix domain-containing protein [Eggerthellaceae bacterium]
MRAARKEAGLSQSQLAQRCGCSQRFVSEVERGKPTAELERALRLLVELGVPIAVGSGNAVVDGRAEVNYAVVRIAEGLSAPPAKRRKLASYLEEASDER